MASYVVKILEGLAYLHCSDVVHCDLKAANILTTKTGNVKLSDFGVSLNLRAIKRKDIVGAPNWMAPEVIELKGASAKSDIWSLGCTVVELLTGRPPYGDIANAMTGTEPPFLSPSDAQSAKEIQFSIIGSHVSNSRGRLPALTRVFLYSACCVSEGMLPQGSSTATERRAVT